MTDRRRSRSGRLSLSTGGVTLPADTRWPGEVSAGMSWSMMFTIYLKVGSARWKTEQRRAAGTAITYWQNSASALRMGRTVRAESQEYSFMRRTWHVATRQRTRAPLTRMTGCVGEPASSQLIRPCRHDLVGEFTSAQFENRSFDVAAHCVERQRIRRDTERLGDFTGNRLQRNERIGNEDAEKRREELRRIDQSERQQNAIGVNGAMKQHAVRKWNRRGRDPFTSADRLTQFVDLRVEHPELRVRCQSPSVQIGKVAANVVEKRNWLVASVLQCLGSRASEKAKEVCSRVGPAQLVLQCIDTRNHRMGQVKLLSVARNVAQHLRRQRARGDQQIAPEMARLIEPLITRVIAEREKDGESEAE